nr:immunoglobulin light chain junction region [Macaca mulatta]MPN91016.1 immunoglobulin light chain junction region [Macaca mulatta]MPN91193.1 immunoglobulin light chain junction region [Macaca mulatta]MPN91234.1 immunoglobulin light chain junction region [Macaca mulatta]MPN91343.1 immunoglobulin light chain junction region [Macaca mulatta]
CMQVLQIPFTF